MVTCRRYDETGQYLGSLSIDLKKSVAHHRLNLALAQSDKSFSYHDMEKLDAGTLELTKLTRLFSAEEIKRAVARRISALEVESEELRGLQALLHDPSGTFAAAQGGEQAEAHGFPGPGKVAKSRRSR